MENILKINIFHKHNKIKIINKEKKLNIYLIFFKKQFLNNNLNRLIKNMKKHF
jgi:hypothetical protein